jgi:phage tail sheath protein FI
MGFQVSPGVEVKEIDLTNVIPAVSSSIGGYSGYFRWGPVNQIGLVSSEKELAGKFGTPDAAHTQSFLTASSFLKYGGALKVVRAGNAQMLNSVETSVGYEVATGGIESVAIASPITQFASATGNETLTITEDAGGSGVGAQIAPLYQVNVTDTEKVAGYTVASIVDSGATLADGVYSAIVDGETLGFTIASSVITIDTNVFLLANSTVSVDALDSLGASTGVNVDLTIDEVSFSSAAAGQVSTGPTQLIGGDQYVVYTEGLGSQAITLTVVDNAGVLEFTIAELSLENQELLNVFPTSQTGLQVYDVDDAAVPGLFFDVVYDIGGIAVEATGAGYVMANITVTLDDDGVGANVPVTLSAGDFIFDEKEEYLKENVLIENEEVFESAYPPVNNNVLPGLMYAKYPGKLGDSIGVYVIDPSSWTTSDLQGQFDSAPDTGEVHVYVYDAGGEITGVEGAELEKWSYLQTEAGAISDDGSNNNLHDVVNSNSNYIYIARELPSRVEPFLFGGGVDKEEGFASIATDTMVGLDVLADTEIVDVNLLFAQNDITGNVIANHLHAIAATRKDCVAFISPAVAASTGNSPLVDVTSWMNGILVRDPGGSYAVLDSTALYVYNKYADNYAWIPASGHMAGLCAKTDDLAEPWFSPAGLNRGSLRGVTKLAFNPKKAERDELYKAGINPIVSFPGQGILLFGDKTAQSKPSAFDRINVRRLFIVLEKAIATAAKYQLFELNDEFTRAMFRNMTEPFLRDVKGRRGVTDFLVVCDETNNTGEVVDTNRFVADIYIKPARSINFITLNFVATRTGVDFSEIVGK